MPSKWASVFGVVSKLAPTIASAVGGPLAGSAVSALEGALGVKTDTNDINARQDAVADAMSAATPDQLLALKKADEDFQAKMAELGFGNAKDLEELATADKQSARSMHTSTRESTPAILSFAITLGFFGLLALLAFHAVPAAARDLLNTMVGALGTAWIAVVQFWFGSSSSSDRKTELLAKAGPVAE